MEDVSLELLSLPSSPLPSTATEDDFPSMSQSVRPPRSQEPERALKPGYVRLEFLHYGTVKYVKVYTLKCEGCNKSAGWWWWWWWGVIRVVFNNGKKGNIMMLEVSRVDDGMFIHNLIFHIM